MHILPGLIMLLKTESKTIIKQTFSLPKIKINLTVYQ